MLEKFEEEVLEGLGIALRDENGIDLPSEVVAREFMERWPTFTSNQQVYTAMIILILRKRHS